MRTGVLSRSGRPVKLQEQPARVLTHLVENAGSLVSREELRELLWPSDTFVEFDTSLNTAIRKVRQSLGDEPESPHFIETVPRKGYKFIAAVTYPISVIPDPGPPRLEILGPPAPVEDVLPELPRAAEVPAITPAARPSWIRFAIIGALLAALAGASAWIWRPRPPSFRGPVTRSSFDLPPGVSVADTFGLAVAISRNGAVVTAIALRPGSPREVYYRRFSDGAVRKIPGTHGAQGVILSPDGERMAFRQDGWLVSSTLDGQDRRRLTRVGGNIPEGGIWTSKNEIYFTAASRRGSNRLNTSLWKIPADHPERLEEVTGILDPNSVQMEWHTNIQELPSGELLLSASRGPTREIWIVDPAKNARALVTKESGGFYSPTGHLIYHRGTTLYAAPLDLGRRELAGPEAAVQQRMAGASWSGGNMALSESGTLVFTQRSRAVTDRTLTWVGLDGKETPMPIPPGPYVPVDLSFDGRSALVAKYEDFEAMWGLWVMPLGPGEWRKVSEGHPYNVAGAFTEDGRTVLFSRMGTGLMRRRLDAPRSEECIAPEVDYTRYPGVLARGQTEILVTEGYHPGITTLLYSLSLDPTPGPPRKLLSSDGAPRLSPDRKWLATINTGHVTVRPFPVAENAPTVRLGRGAAPVWSADGKTVYFVNANREMVAVPFLPGSPPTIGEPHVLFNAARYDTTSRWHSSYPIARDGHAFLMARIDDTTPDLPANTIHVAENWFSEVSRLAQPAR